MIDCENKVIDTVAAPLRAEYPGIFIPSEYVPIPKSFPTVSIIQMDNYTYTKSMTIDGVEHQAVSPFEINVYSDLVSGKKEQCKAIMSSVDTLMQGLGFTRKGMSPREVPNAEKSICRMIARYDALAGENNEIYKTK